MTPITEVQALGSVVFDPAVLSTQAASTQPVGSFASFVVREIGATNERLIQAEQGVQQLALGETASLHDVMIRLEEARLSMQLLVQVRNRMLEAYQEVMRTQA